MKRILIGLVFVFFSSISIYPMRYWNMFEIASINDPSGQVCGSFGLEIANGDLNGDGFTDLISSSCYDSGMVFIWFGGVSFDTIVDLTLKGQYDTFGVVISSADVNKDGYDDLLVRTLFDEVSLYYGGDPMDTTVDWIVHSHTAHSWFGYCISLSDLNSDGCADIIIGDPVAGAGAYNWGAVYIYWGGENPDTICDVTIQGVDQSNFGWKLSSRYDVNGDGISDLAEGAPSAAQYFPRISVFYGSETTEFDTIPDVKIYNPCNGGENGRTGTENGDGV